MCHKIQHTAVKVYIWPALAIYVYILCCSEAIHKPEKHNISQRRQKMTELQQQATRTKIADLVVEIYPRGQKDTQTHTGWANKVGE